jgi:hypothetical protein
MQTLRWASNTRVAHNSSEDRLASTSAATMERIGPQGARSNRAADGQLFDRGRSISMGVVLGDPTAAAAAGRPLASSPLRE